jgi:hypothetical protein
LKNLQTLNLTSTIHNLSQSHYSAFCRSIAELHGLTSLDLSGNNLGRISLENVPLLFGALAKLENLTSLNLNGIEFKEMSVEIREAFFRELTTLKNLKSLELKITDLSEEIVRDLLLPTLKESNIDSLGLDIELSPALKTEIDTTLQENKNNHSYLRGVPGNQSPPADSSHSLRHSVFFRESAQSPGGLGSMTASSVPTGNL